MDLFALVTHHGYAIVAIILFLSACGLPMPLSVVLLLAGSAAHGGSLRLEMVLLTGLLALSAGDNVMYLGGRLTGWWLLAGICRISMNPEACIFGSAHSFYRRGQKTLIFSKFIPGLATVSAPLAGSLNMRWWTFLRLDAVGVAMYVSAWTLVGFVFAPFVKSIVALLQRIGHVTGEMVLAIVGLYVAWLAYNWIHDKRFSKVEKIAAHELWERMKNHTHDRVMVIADVRSHGYYDPGMKRIKNSIRVEPSRLKEELVALREFMAPECDIYLYCSCAHEATSVRVAHMLEQENCRTKVIQGGLKAWLKAGGPVEEVPEGDVEHLPRFN
jgi:membrane protein DedA with SNARE-associated domain/rhodanese-related sulfurtransferase